MILVKNVLMLLQEVVFNAIVNWKDNFIKTNAHVNMVIFMNALSQFQNNHVMHATLLVNLVLEINQINVLNVIINHKRGFY